MTLLKEEGFKYTQQVKIKEGDTEKVFPLYDMEQMRAGLLYTEDIPPEIGDNVSKNIVRIKDRLQVSEKVIDEPCAVVGFGPTLKKFGERLKDFRHIITTSGAHKYLIDRDIIPSYHVEIDYRERKAVHTKESHPDVEYLLGSIVHPAVLDNVEGKRCKLWHIKLTGIEYPKDELVLEGYWDVGQEAILVAKTLGYRNLHLFGFDYAIEVDTDKTHAGFHNGMPINFVFAKCNNKYFKTTDNLARGVMVFQALMEDNTDLGLTIYSDGLLSEYLNYHYINKGKEDTSPALSQQGVLSNV